LIDDRPINKTFYEKNRSIDQLSLTFDVLARSNAERISASKRSK